MKVFDKISLHGGIDSREVGVFRFLLISYAIVLALGFTSIFFWTPNYPQEAVRYLAWYSKQPRDVVQASALWIDGAAGVTSVIGALGMVFFRQWALRIFTTAIVASVVCGLFMTTPALVTRIDVLLDTYTSVSGGMAIALAYWSPIKDKFNNYVQK
jgi:hypothetical protein